MKKVLVLGSTGMLGHMVHHFLDSTKTYDLYNLSYRNKLNSRTIILDITNQKRFLKKIEEISPDIIINCVGILIKGSKENIKNAIYINSYFPHLLKETCKTTNSKLIHISTDCVFSGKSGNYSENSIKDTLDIYGKTKSLGEFNDENHLCIRTSIIGPEIKEKGEGLMHWFFNQSGVVKGFKNVFWGGVTTLELSKTIHFSINNNISGLWNLTNGKSISKYDLLYKISSQFDLINIQLESNVEKFSNKSLSSIREINYKVPSYDEMLVDLAQYFQLNKNQYNYRV